jgi:deoxyribonuclease V
MQPSLQHDWNLSWTDARRVQESLARQVVRHDDFPEPRIVAGIDLGYPRTASGEVQGRAAVVLLRLPELEVVEEHVVVRPVTFPYVPGLLSFREAPVALAALELLERRPDVLLVDGHGIAHPRRLGIASHLGVLLDLPTVGCAKSVLVGRAPEPGPAPGDSTLLRDRGEVIGAAVRTKVGSRPLYVSTGHRVSLEAAIALVLRCTRGYRLPEPTRLADRLASRRGLPAPPPE